MMQEFHLYTDISWSLFSLSFSNLQCDSESDIDDKVRLNSLFPYASPAWKFPYEKNKNESNSNIIFSFSLHVKFRNISNLYPLHKMIVSAFALSLDMQPSFLLLTQYSFLINVPGFSRMQVTVLALFFVLEKDFPDNSSRANILFIITFEHVSFIMGLEDGQLVLHCLWG